MNPGTFANWLERLNAGCTSQARRTRPPATVLVVDDEDSVRRFVARVMTEAGCEVVTAVDGADAVATAARLGSIDLLVTDLMMPEMAGDELARRLRQTDGDLPVLYLTGFSDRLFAERMQLWEHEAFLDKPCTVQGLLEAATLVSGGHVSGAIPHRTSPPVEQRPGAVSEVA